MHATTAESPERPPLGQVPSRAYTSATGRLMAGPERQPLGQVPSQLLEEMGELIIEVPNVNRSGKSHHPDWPSPLTNVARSRTSTARASPITSPHQRHSRGPNLVPNVNRSGKSHHTFAGPGHPATVPNVNRSGKSHHQVRQPAAFISVN
jgi:hypothetical protein